MSGNSRLFIIKPYKIIVFLVVLLAFEDFFLKWVPVSDAIFIGLRLVSELIVYLTLILVFVNKIAKHRSIDVGAVNTLLILFIFCAFLSVALNGSSLVNAIVSLRSMLRYVALYYIVININITEKQSSHLLYLIVVVALIQAGIGVVQYLGPDILTEIFAPRKVETDVGVGDRNFNLFGGVYKLGAVAGSLGQPVTFSMLLLIASVIILSRIWFMKSGIARLKLLVVALILLLGIVFSYKRGVLAITLMILPIIYLLYSDRRKKIFISSALMVLMIVTLSFFSLRSGVVVKEKTQEISPLASLTQLSYGEYWERTMRSSRGWFISQVGSTMLSSVSILGYSADQSFAKEKLASIGGAFGKLASYNAFEDVYWVSMLVYYGLLGVAIYLMMMLKLYRVGKHISIHGNGDWKLIGTVLCALTIIALPLNFLYQGWDIRTFSFYYWLLAGLVVNHWAELKTKKKDESLSET